MARPDLSAPAASALPDRPPRRRFAAVRSIMALILREMSTRYGASPGGYLWAILEPLGMILVLSFAFSLLLRAPSLGNSFILFYATGYLPFNLYQTIAGTVGLAIAFNRALLKYPTVSWMDAILARFILNSLTGILVSYLLLSAILMLTDTRTVLDLRPIVLAMLLAMLLGLGIGALNCVLLGLFPVWTHVWRIVTRPLFLASGVLYIYEDLPQVAQNILWFNPLVHITGLMRTGFYPMYRPDYISLTYVLLWALVPMMFGFLLLRRHHRQILNR